MRRLALILCLLAAAAPAAQRIPLDPAMEKGLRAYLDRLCRHILQLDVASGTLKNTKDTNWSIFINANLSRVLLGANRLSPNPDYLHAALDWCDFFHHQQGVVLTSSLEEGSFWADRGSKGNIYFGDAGTATTALAIASRYADPNRAHAWRAALARYTRFVRRGSLLDPQDEGRQTSTGWVIETGPDRGALGCGYYKGRLSLEPYNIATATTGAAFFSEWYALTHDPEAKRIASAAVRWLFRHRTPDGAILCSLGGQTPASPNWPLAYMTYVGEGWMAAWRLLDDLELRMEIADQVKPSIEWILAQQRPDGSWGEPGSGDQQRAAGVLSLLSWYYSEVRPDPRVADSVRRFYRYLLDPKNAANAGAFEFVRTTGFIGLAIEETLQPGLTY